MLKWGAILLAAVSALSFLNSMFEIGFSAALLNLLAKYDEIISAVFGLIPDLFGFSVPDWYLQLVSISAIATTTVSLSLNVLVERQDTRWEVPDDILEEALGRTNGPTELELVVIPSKHGPGRIFWHSSRLFRREVLPVWIAVLWAMSYTLIPIPVLIYLIVHSLWIRISVESECILWQIQAFRRRWNDINPMTGRSWSNTPAELAETRRVLPLRIWRDYQGHRSEKTLERSIATFKEKDVHIPLVGKEPVGVYASLVLFLTPSVLAAISLATVVIIITTSFING